MENGKWKMENCYHSFRAPHPNPPHQGRVGWEGEATANMCIVQNMRGFSFFVNLRFVTFPLKNLKFFKISRYT